MSDYPTNQELTETAVSDSFKVGSFGSRQHMSFILGPRQGGDLQVNAWNWRPTLELLRAENVIDSKTCELMGAQGCGGQADAEFCLRIAWVIEDKLKSMRPGERIRADLTVTADPKKLAQFGSNEPVDAVNLYSATYEWLTTFKDFCDRCGGFRVV